MTDVRHTTVAVRDAALALAADEASGELTDRLAHLIVLLCDAVDEVATRQLAPVVPIARRPDYTPPPDITLATVLDTPEALQRWRDENGGRS